MYLLHNVVHGSQATPVYTLMLRCSQNAPPSVRTACYSFLGTLEILGKQLSLFMAGVLTQSFGYVAALNISLIVAVCVVLLVWYCPKYLRWRSYKDLQFVAKSPSKSVSCLIPKPKLCFHTLHKHKRQKEKQNWYFGCLMLMFTLPTWPIISLSLNVD